MAIALAKRTTDCVVVNATELITVAVALEYKIACAEAEAPALNDPAPSSAAPAEAETNCTPIACVLSAEKFI